MATEDARLILAFQRRPLSDVLFQRIIHYLCSIGGSFWFVFAAKSGPPPSSDLICGDIYIYKSKFDWRNSADQAIRRHIINLNEHVFSTSPDRDDECLELHDLAIAHLKQTADIDISVILRRTGEVYISPPRFSDSDLEYASVDFSRQCGHDFSKWVSDQSYFFLRDISHAHQHHTPSSDTILILQERREENDDVTWRKNIVFSLQFYIIRLKRFSDVAALYQSAGILAYCNSFRKICTRRLRDKAEEIPEFSDEALLQSLTAKAKEQITEIQRFNNDQMQRLARASNIRFFSLTVIVALLALMAVFISHNIEKYTILNQISVYLSENFLPIVAIMAAALVAIWGLTHNGWHLEKNIGRDLLEVANVRRKRAIFLFVAVGIFLIGTSIYLGWEAVNWMLVPLRGIWESVFFG